MVSLVALRPSGKHQRGEGLRVFQTLPLPRGEGMVARMLTREEVLKIAKLARLDLSESEVESYRSKMGRVLEHIHELNALSTPQDAFVRHVPKDAVSLRGDTAISFSAPRTLLENAPQAEENCFLLPTIVEHE